MGYRKPDIFEFIETVVIIEIEKLTGLDGRLVCLYVEHFQCFFFLSDANAVAQIVRTVGLVWHLTYKILSIIVIHKQSFYDPLC